MWIAGFGGAAGNGGFFLFESAMQEIARIGSGNVRYWHSADIPTAATNVRFRAVKRTIGFEVSMSVMTQSGHREISFPVLTSHRGNAPGTLEKMRKFQAFKKI